MKETRDVSDAISRKTLSIVHKFELKIKVRVCSR